jgi:hypothetical protein
MSTDVPTPEIPEHERTWMRNAQTGELGYQVKIGGADYIRLNRATEDIRIPFRAGEWIPDVDRRPFTGAQVAQICHAADLVLCRSLGLFKEAKLDWLSLPDKTRAEMIRGQGPMKPGIRAKVWGAIWSELKDYYR